MLYIQQPPHMCLLGIFHLYLLAHIAQSTRKGFTTVSGGKGRHRFRLCAFALCELSTKNHRILQYVNLSQLYRIFIATLTLSKCDKNAQKCENSVRKMFHVCENAKAPCAVCTFLAPPFTEASCSSLAHSL